VSAGQLARSRRVADRPTITRDGRVADRGDRVKQSLIPPAVLMSRRSRIVSGVSELLRGKRLTRRTAPTARA
jgi:hypothetical protein